jgi:hypothetical protein
LPDVNEGLEIGGEPLVSYDEGDVNTQDGFNSGLARAAGIEAPAEPDTPAEEPAEEETPEEEETSEEETQDWERRYWEAQRIIDRQGNELGEFRRGQVERVEAAPAYTPQPAPAPFDASGMVETYGGQQTIDWAIDNAPDKIDEIARQWALSGDPEGAVFYADYRAEQVKIDSTPPPQAPQPLDPALAEVATTQKMAGLFRELRESDPEFSQYEDGLAAALSSHSTPDEIKLMLMSGNLDHMRSGMQFLKPYAQIEALRAGGSQQPPETAAEPSVEEETRRDAARRTAIVSGSQRLQAAGAPPPEGELTSEQRIERFKEQFDEEPSTSIAAGLTFNGQPVLQPRPRRSA